MAGCGWWCQECPCWSWSPSAMSRCSGSWHGAGRCPRQTTNIVIGQKLWWLASYWLLASGYYHFGSQMTFWDKLNIKWLCSRDNWAQIYQLFLFISRPTGTWNCQLGRQQRGQTRVQKIVSGFMATNIVFPHNPSPCTGFCRWPQQRRRTRWGWARQWPEWRGSPWARMAETDSLLHHQRSQNCGHCNRSYLKCRVLGPSVFGSLILWPSSGGRMRNLDDSWCVETLTMTGLLCPPTSLA